MLLRQLVGWHGAEVPVSPYAIGVIRFSFLSSRKSFLQHAQYPDMFTRFIQYELCPGVRPGLDDGHAAREKGHGTDICRGELC